MSDYDVAFKTWDEIRIASVRQVVPTPADQGDLWKELGGHLRQHHVRPAGACFTIYHDDEYKERDWDLEVCEPIVEELVESDRVRVRAALAVPTVACTVHNGPFVTIGEAYNAIGKWITANGYGIVGPCREVYLREAKNLSQNDPDTVTEIQFPVEKTAKQ